MERYRQHPVYKPFVPFCWVFSAITEYRLIWNPTGWLCSIPRPQNLCECDVERALNCKKTTDNNIIRDFNKSFKIPQSTLRNACIKMRYNAFLDISITKYNKRLTQVWFLVTWADYLQVWQESSEKGCHKYCGVVYWISMILLGTYQQILS